MYYGTTKQAQTSISATLVEVKLPRPTTKLICMIKVNILHALFVVVGCLTSAGLLRLRVMIELFQFDDLKESNFAQIRENTVLPLVTLR